MFVLCQTIQTMWTKASRGGAGAQRRAAIPDAFSVDIADRSGPGFTDHRLFYEPFDDPQHRAESITFPFEAGAVAVLQEDTGVMVTYRWDRNYVGAPERWTRGPGGMRLPVERTLRCRRGEWVRIRYNGRSSGRRDYFPSWSYLKLVVNIAVFDSARHADGSVFCTSEPTAEVTDLEPLW